MTASSRSLRLSATSAILRREKMAWVRWLTRKEAKEATRQRLLRAAPQILNERGETDVSASTVAPAAGIAQPSFYEHSAKG